jgi:hypothetical protein
MVRVGLRPRNRRIDNAPVLKLQSCVPCFYAYYVTQTLYPQGVRWRGSHPAVRCRLVHFELGCQRPSWRVSTRRRLPFKCEESSHYMGLGIEAPRKRIIIIIVVVGKSSYYSKPRAIQQTSSSSMDECGICNYFFPFFHFYSSLGEIARSRH